MEGRTSELLQRALDELRQERTVERIWARDASLWKEQPEHQSIISNALGWLDVVPVMLTRIDELTAFADEVRRDVSHVVVLGMGGSSLCSEVFRSAFGHRDGFPRLHVLDSTVPAAVASLQRAIDLDETLFIVASKSGTTTEPQMFYRYFLERMRERKGSRAAASFVAVTDPGTQFEKEARDEGFRAVFLNPSDIGGRYSALSLFGMVPAALAGIDIRALLERARDAAEACRSEALEKNPGAILGAAIGAHAREGRNKLTIVARPPFDALGLWIEQLVAESSGKEQKGVLPIAQEPLEAPEAYGGDRFFVGIAVGDAAPDLDALGRAGHPVVMRRLASPIDLGAEFFVWEFATAVAGAMLAINPFDQPNVQESKDNTRRLIASYREKGELPQPREVARAEGVRLSAEGAAAEAASEGASASEWIGALLGGLAAGDYVAFMLYLEQTPQHDEVIAAVRSGLMRARRVATTSGYGPRFLHSTGQFHKGGPNSGLFFQITADDTPDLAIPGEPFSFGVLKDAQSLGDLDALVSHGRRVVRFHLGAAVEPGLAVVRDLFRQALAAIEARAAE